jgi:hypothetical protein
MIHFALNHLDCVLSLPIIYYMSSTYRHLLQLPRTYRRTPLFSFTECLAFTDILLYSEQASSTVNHLSLRIISFLACSTKIIEEDSYMILLSPLSGLS